jgi:hypothetical protein
VTWRKATSRVAKKMMRRPREANATCSTQTKEQCQQKPNPVHDIIDPDIPLCVARGTWWSPLCSFSWPPAAPGSLASTGPSAASSKCLHFWTRTAPTRYMRPDGGHLHGTWRSDTVLGLMTCLLWGLCQTCSVKLLTTKIRDQMLALASGWMDAYRPRASLTKRLGRTGHSLRPVREFQMIRFAFRRCEQLKAK